EGYTGGGTPLSLCAGWNAATASATGREPSRVAQSSSSRPAARAEIRDVLAQARGAGRHVKVVGLGTPPSDIACTEDFMVSLERFNRVLQVDQESRRVTVQAGAMLSDLNEELAKHGLALSNIGAVSDVTVGGVIGTGTHNTGAAHGILPTQVCALSLMLASGEVVSVSAESNRDLLSAVRVHLGALGVVLTVSLQCVAAFRLAQRTFPSTLAEVLGELDTHLSRSEFFKFFWFPYTDHVTVFYIDRTDQPIKNPRSWFWDRLVGYYLFEFLLWLSVLVPRLVPWINRVAFRALFSGRTERVDRSDRIFNFDCLFLQHVQDWALPRERAGWALTQLSRWVQATPSVPAHVPVEVRFARADDILMSPCSGRDSCYINIITYRPYNREAERDAYWAAYEDIMRRAGGRPHWAKAHGCTAEDLSRMYPGLEEFARLRSRLDPHGLFLNPYLQRVFTGAGEEEGEQRDAREGRQPAH
uniref:L-gulonolactone oxidase n=1 Tax=Petromyzon marinus TaxID=7757 RepID=A0AAJ7WTA7_PETMA